ncbi:Uncharacterized protein conserved in bacteria [Citrobacter koseri]|uniref:Uncharacterized protein conserved in bacteria n=1 Tax=Citrobacter koseri TaxID=545 RepID=A0A447UKM0_CITKO|nr:Uncharacterized protein conserved in bacteria [Citrobacter koseri]
MATMKNRVLWQEGMFALPQHFQQQQRHNDAMLRERAGRAGGLCLGIYGAVAEYRTSGTGQSDD